MSIIKIKRGQSANIKNLSLETGELAVTLDTKELYVGDNDQKPAKVGQTINNLKDGENNSLYQSSCAPSYTIEGDTINLGQNSIELGSGSIAEGNASIAAGSEVWAKGQGAIALGKDSYADGEGAIALGDSAAAIGNAAYAEGYMTQAKANITHAEGAFTVAGVEGTTGIYSHAEGYGTQATANCAHSEGISTQATGANAHAEGQSTTASGTSAHAEGNTTMATGLYSHTEGTSTMANGLNAHAEGLQSVASGENQHVEGKFNLQDSNSKYAHILGIGNFSTRANGYTVDWNGNAWYAGKVLIGGTSQDDGKELSTKEYVDGLIANVNGGGDPGFILTETSNADNIQKVQQIMEALNNNKAVKVFYQYGSSYLPLSKVNKTSSTIQFVFEKDGTSNENAYGIAYIRETTNINVICTIIDNQVTSYKSQDTPYAFRNVHLRETNQILGMANTAEYTPSGPYNPATKKYVDDELSNSLSTVSNKISFNNEKLLVQNNFEFTQTDTHETYKFEYNEETQTFTNNNSNINAKNSTVLTTVTLTQPLKNVTVTYTVNTETSDKFTATYNETTVANNINGVNKTGTLFEGNLESGDIFTFKYVKDGSMDSNGDKVEIHFDFNSTVEGESQYLATNVDYQTVYEPLYNGSPATKKYVDDSVSAISGGGSGGSGISPIESNKDCFATEDIQAGNLVSIDTLALSKEAFAPSTEYSIYSFGGGFGNGTVALGTVLGNVEIAINPNPTSTSLALYYKYESDTVFKTSSVMISNLVTKIKNKLGYYSLLESNTAIYIGKDSSGTNQLQALFAGYGKENQTDTYIKPIIVNIVFSVSTVASNGNVSITISDDNITLLENFFTIAEGTENMTSLTIVPSITWIESKQKYAGCLFYKRTYKVDETSTKTSGVYCFALNADHTIVRTETKNEGSFNNASAQGYEKPFWITIGTTHKLIYSTIFNLTLYEDNEYYSDTLFRFNVSTYISKPHLDSKTIASSFSVTSLYSGCQITLTEENAAGNLVENIYWASGITAIFPSTDDIGMGETWYFLALMNKNGSMKYIPIKKLSYGNSPRAITILFNKDESKLFTIDFSNQVIAMYDLNTQLIQTFDFNKYSISTSLSYFTKNTEGGLKFYTNSDSNCFTLNPDIQVSLISNIGECRYIGQAKETKQKEQRILIDTWTVLR